jgi:hypothetical protein
MAKTKQNPLAGLKIHANLPANYLIKDVSRPTPKIKNASNGQYLLVFGSSSTGRSMVYANENQAKEYEAQHETSLVKALGRVGDNDVLVLYYMILDKLHEANYKNPVAFKWAELCDITGETRVEYTAE